MPEFPPTLILRHRKENLKKCSLRGLEERSDMQFYSYPLIKPLPALNQYFVLTLEAPFLSEEEASLGLLLIDGTWRYAEKMIKILPDSLLKRSLRPSVQTAYPRRQEDCIDPSRGLASVEALYLAYRTLGRDTTGLLDSYYWKESFLRNAEIAFPEANKLK